MGGRAMKILIAPDSFKGSNSSAAVAERIEAGVKKVFPSAEIIKLPIADGGEGTVEALVLGAGGQLHQAQVTGPMGKPVTAAYGILSSGIGVIEMAAASGLPLVPENERNPLNATTFGVGELLLEALDCGCTSIVIGLGGSATNDGGVGMAQALGISFKDRSGRELKLGAAGIAELATVDTSGMNAKVSGASIVIASDVNSPLCGPKGASQVFGPQKGADVDKVKKLDNALAHLADTVKSQLGIDISDTPGAGAAGGLGYGLMAFCGAKMKPGIETVMDSLGIDKLLDGCDLVITGEGKIDGQSVFGKVPVGVAQRAKKNGVPVLAIVGGIGDGAEAVYQHGIDSIMSIFNRAIPLSEAMANGGALLEEAAERAMRIIKIGMGINRK
jgi:glycerate kinase